MRKIHFKFAFALVLVLACSVASTQAAARKKDKKSSYGQIAIRTNPVGVPIFIDGVQRGVTYDPAEPIDVVPGHHIVEIRFSRTKVYRQEFDVEAGRKNCLCLNYVRNELRHYCPYPVSVAVDKVYNDGDIITFASDVSYGGPTPLTYTWSVSPGSARIDGPANSTSLRVDSTGLGGQTITASLVVEDGSGDPNCRQMADASVTVRKPPPPPVTPRRFVEFPSIAFDDDKANLDNFAIELQNSPDSQGYVIVYSGVNSRAGTADRLMNRAQSYLTHERNLDASRVQFVNGGYRDSDYFELWVVPRGATPPPASPTRQPGEARPSIRTPTRRIHRGRR